MAAVAVLLFSNIIRHWPRNDTLFVCQSWTLNTLRPRQNGRQFPNVFNAFLWMKIVGFRLNFHWTMFSRVKLTIDQCWFRYWLDAIIWTNDGYFTDTYMPQWVKSNSGNNEGPEFSLAFNPGCVQPLKYENISEEEIRPEEELRHFHVAINYSFRPQYNTWRLYESIVSSLIWWCIGCTMTGHLMT